MKRYVGFVPTNSLFQIHEMVDNDLDNKIFVLRGRHVWGGQSRKVVINDYLSVYSAPSQVAIVLNYDSRKHKGQFNMNEVVEKAAETEAQDIFIDQLSFRFFRTPGNRATEYHVHFENLGPRGGDVVDLVTRIRKHYLKKHGMAMTSQNMKRRILAFKSAQSLDGHIIDPMQTCTKVFVDSLSKETNGLIMLLEQETGVAKLLRDKSFEFMSSLWEKESADADVRR